MPVLVALAVIVLLVVFLIAGPLLSILALNTLFGLSIPYTLGTWAATLWLSLIVGGVRTSDSRRSGRG